MFILISFLAGILFALIILPFLQGWVDLFLVWVETKKSNLSKVIHINNNEIENLSCPDCQPIGFHVDYEENDFEEESFD